MKVQEKSAEYLVGSLTAEWKRGTLGELLPIKYGKSLPEKLRDTTGSHPVFGSSGLVGAHSSALTSGPTLIIGRKGNVGAIHYSSEACWPIDTVYYVEPPEGQNLRYYKYLLESLNLVKLDKSTAVPGLSRDDYNAVEVAVAPPDQQDSIVAEIEKQFSRFDEAVANLKRVKANLKRYKAAVLKAAVEGRLVENEAERARREGRSDETGAQLLQRILETRRSQWQGKGKYKEPAAPDTDDLPELPEGWVWANIGQLCFFDSGEAFKKADYSSDGLRLLQIANVGFSQVEWVQRNYLPLNFGEKFPELLLQVGDIVLALNRPIIGERLKVASVSKKDLPAILYQRVGRLRPTTGGSPAYLFNFFQSPHMLAGVRKRLQGTDQPYLNTSLVPDITVPFPPLAEQHRIVAEIDRRLTLLRATEAQVDANLQRAERLRQSVLQRAFTATSVGNISRAAQ